jgi:hypothetical protein
MPGTFFPCPGASTPAMYYQDVTGVVNTPSLPVFEPQTYSVPMTLKGDAFTSATLAKAYEWATPIPPADASAFSGPVNINVNVSEGVYPTDAAGSLQVFSDAFAGTANVTATLLVGPLSRPKPTLLQKTGSAAEIAVISALTRALTAECPPCGVLYGTFTAPVISGLRKIVQDPDDPNYMVLATLDIPPTIALPDIPGLTAEQIALWNDLNENLALLDPLAEALAESIDRAQGAYDAGNEFWAAAQLANFNDYYQQDLTYATAVDSDAVMLGLVSASGGPGTPEPSTWTMMLLGFAGLGYLGYRSSRKSIALAV